MIAFLRVTTRGFLCYYFAIFPSLKPWKLQSIPFLFGLLLLLSVVSLQQYFGEAKDIPLALSRSVSFLSHSGQRTWVLTLARETKYSCIGYLKPVMYGVSLYPGVSSISAFLIRRTGNPHEN